jgi:hypothetical protein
MPIGRISFETKLLLLFAVVMIVVLSLGSGRLSFDEAKSRADSSKLSLDPAQLDRLARAQRRFSQQAIPMCIQSTGKLPEDFSIVIDIAADGTIGRSWRRGNSQFLICYQTLLRENFIFRPYSQPFFAAFEYNKTSSHGM